MNNKFYFSYYVIRRMMKILPRKSKTIRLLHFSCTDTPDTKGMITIKCKFTNAVYFKIDGQNSLSSSVTIPKPVDEGTVHIEVKGFMKSSEFCVSVTGGDAVITRLASVSSYMKSQPLPLLDSDLATAS